MEHMNFKQWIEMSGTGAVYDPNQAPCNRDFQWWGTPQRGITATPKKKPIQNWTKSKKNDK
jgi:hypothetical protein